MPVTYSEKALQVRNSSTLAITARAKALKAAGVDLVSFGAGEPNFPTPENICDAAVAAIRGGKHGYTPVTGIPELKGAISHKFKEFNHIDYTPEQIVVSSGGKQCLSNAFQAIINPGDEVIIPVPFWLSYPELIRLCGGVPVFLQCNPENGYKVTPELIAGAVTERTKALVLNDPNNPTGAVYEEEELFAIGRLAVEKEFFIISDEMYEALVYEGRKHVSIASLSPEIFERTITVCGLSKSYAMTGWRMGYTGAPTELSRLMGNIQSHQAANTCSITQAAAVEALAGSQEQVKMMHDAFERRRRRMLERVRQMPHVTAMEGFGAFYVVVDFSELFGREYGGRLISDAADIGEILINDFNTVVIPCNDFGMPTHIRLSYALSEEDIEKGLDRIESFLKKM